jgi:glycosyltransferase involved in cell wall biosynthesis
VKNGPPTLVRSVHMRQSCQNSEPGFLNSGMKRINLLHLITELEPGGAENLLLNICRGFDKKKFNILVAYIYGSGTLAGQFRRTGVRVVDLSRRGRMDLLLLFKLAFLIRKERIRILHTHLVHASIAGRIAAKLAGIRNIITTRHYGYYHKEKSLVSWIERKTAAFNSEFIAISNAVKEYMVKREKYKPEIITVVYNAVDLTLFDPGDSEILPHWSDDFLIGTAGRLHPSKGYDTLLESMSQVVERFPQTTLMIAGNGALKDHLENLCSRLSISDKIVFLGRITPAEIGSLLRRINLFVLASNWEGFGLAVAEAMASGKPVLVTDVGGLRELVDDGATGLLVPPGEPTLLAQKIMYMIENKKHAQRMGLSAREKIARNFSLEAMVNKLNEFYESLLRA